MAKSTDSGSLIDLISRNALGKVSPNSERRLMTGSKDLRKEQEKFRKRYEQLYPRMKKQ